MVPVSTWMWTLVRYSFNRLNQFLIASKTRVAPMSKQTIPRLELLSSLLASRLTESIKSALEDVKKLDSVTYWSDSTAVLCWIRSPNNEFKQIVENRMVEIRRLAPHLNYGSMSQPNKTQQILHPVEQQRPNSRKTNYGGTALNF